MKWRVCIPCAGTGSRLGDLTRHLNKALVSIGNRPAVCHLIERFPPDAEFVVALGHKGNLLKEFISIAYPDRRFLFAEVNPYEGPGSGLGLSMLACREHLQQPFVFVSCDTLVDEPIPPPGENWMGYSLNQAINSYRTVKVVGDHVCAIAEKGMACPENHHAYIGLAGIRNFEAFWSVMAAGGAEAIEMGESYGLRCLINEGVTARRFTWHDTGNPDALERTRELYREAGEPNILKKADEAIWFVGDAVIKYSEDRQFIANRVQRVSTSLGGYVPEVTAAGANMYRYQKVQGQVLSDVVNLPRFKQLLDYCKRFWQLATQSRDDSRAFRESCMRFYRDKTYERVAQFYRTYLRQDGTEAINGVPMPTLESLLSRVDWVWLANGRPGRYHGDFHFENIICAEGGRFVFVDWRQDFAGDLKTGDIYYDLAKLMHGLIVSHELISRELFDVRWQVTDIQYDLHRKQSLVACERYFERWLTAEGYDVRKVRVLAALIYLNIAALHHHPYCLLLFVLGKSMLYEELEGLCD